MDAISAFITSAEKFYNSTRTKPSSQVVAELRDTIRTSQANAVLLAALAMIEAVTGDSSDEQEPDAPKRYQRRKSLK